MTPPDRTQLETFRTMLDERLGMSFHDRRLGDLEEVLIGRARATGRSTSAYLAGLNAIPCETELRAVAEHLTIGETYFFRNPNHFRALVEVALPQAIRAAGGRRRVRILSAGCASGEEAHTLAILAREALGESAAELVEIVGIDVNPAVVEKARQARYGAWSLRATPNSVRDRYFIQDRKGHVLQGSLRAMARFEARNLLGPDDGFWQREHFDIVFCRNVLIYFSADGVQRAIDRFAQTLMAGGFLFLGDAESLRGKISAFDVQQTHDTFYYRVRDGLDPTPRPALRAIEPDATNAACVTSVATVQSEVDGSWMDAIQGATDRIAQLGRPSKPSASPARSARAPSSAPSRHPSAYPAGPAAADRSRIDAAMDLIERERFAEALEALDALPAGSQLDAEVLLLRAVVLTNRGAVGAAEEACAKVLAQDERSAGAHYLMALCHEQRGDTAAAARHDQVATYLDPTFAMPRMHLGLLAKRAGDVRTARRELEHAESLLRIDGGRRIALFGGGFAREGLVRLCRAENRRSPA